jgi:sulfur carrier protein
MDVLLNGECQPIDPSSTLAELIARLYGEQTVAVALNGRFVAREQRQETFLAEGDELEILSPRQGG